MSIAIPMKLIGVSVVARRLGQNRKTIMAMIARGELTGVRVGKDRAFWRIDAASVDDYILKGMQR